MGRAAPPTRNSGPAEGANSNVIMTSPSMFRSSHRQAPGWRLADLMALQKGSPVGSTAARRETVDVVVNGRKIARGEIRCRKRPFALRHQAERNMPARRAPEWW